MRHMCVSAAVLAASLLVVSSAAGQSPAARSSVTGAIGAVNFDVDGVGTSTGVSGRGAYALTPRVTVEGNVAWAKNDETLFDSTLWVIEGHVHYHWLVGDRVRPFAGGGAGLFVNDNDFVTDRSLTLSAAAGVRVDLTDRLSALGEFRIRGVEIDFAGSLAEVWFGLSIDVGR